MPGRSVGVVLVLGSLACRAQTPTQLVVVVQSDLDVPAEIDRLQVRVNDRAPSSDPFALAGPEALPASFGVRPRGGDASRRATIEVTALSGGVPVVSQQAITTFVADQRMRIDLYLSAACRDVRCRPGETCWFGHCTGAGVARDELRPWVPGEPALDAGLGPDASPPDAGLDAGLDASPDAGVDAGRLAAAGELCERDVPCDEGLSCSTWDIVNLGYPGSCLVDCGATSHCTALDPDTVCMAAEGKSASVGVCTRACDPTSAVGQCPPGLSCTVFGTQTLEGPVATVTLCLPFGAEPLGAACVPTDCAPPLQCIGSVCHDPCAVGVTVCPDGTTCRSLNPPLLVDTVNYGACLP